MLDVLLIVVLVLSALLAGAVLLRAAHRVAGHRG